MILTEKELLKQESAFWEGPLPALALPSVLRTIVRALIIVLTPLVVCYQLSQLFLWPHWPHKVRQGYQARLDRPGRVRNVGPACPGSHSNQARGLVEAFQGGLNFRGALPAFESRQLNALRLVMG